MKRRAVVVAGGEGRQPVPDWVCRLSAGDWSALAGTVDEYPHVAPYRRWRAANGYPLSAWYDLTRPGML